MNGSNARADERGDTPWRRLPAPVAGAAAAVGAVSLGLVLIGACGLGGQDTYVAPPPLNADLQAAPVVSSSPSGTTTPAVLIPPSPTWRVAADQPPRHSAIPTVTVSVDPENPDADPGATTSRTTPFRATTPPPTTRPRPTTTDSPAPTTESTRPTTAPPVTSTEPVVAVPPTTERPTDDG